MKVEFERQYVCRVFFKSNGAQILVANGSKTLGGASCPHSDNLIHGMGCSTVIRRTKSTATVRSQIVSVKNGSTKDVIRYEESTKTCNIM